MKCAYCLAFKSGEAMAQEDPPMCEECSEDRDD